MMWGGEGAESLARYWVWSVCVVSASERKDINTPLRHGSKSVGHFQKSADIREEMPRAALDSGSLIISLF